MWHYLAHTCITISCAGSCVGPDDNDPGCLNPENFWHPQGAAILSSGGHRNVSCLSRSDPELKKSSGLTGSITKSTKAPSPTANTTTSYLALDTAASILLKKHHTGDCLLTNGGVLWERDCRDLISMDQMQFEMALPHRPLTTAVARALPQPRSPQRLLWTPAYAHSRPSLCILCLWAGGNSGTSEDFVAACVPSASRLHLPDLTLCRTAEQLAHLEEPAKVATN